jgi:hypothetical protein
MENGKTVNWKKGMQRIALLVGSILCVISIGYIIWRIVGPTISGWYEPPFEKDLLSIFIFVGFLLFLFCVYAFVYIFSGPWWNEGTYGDWISIIAFIVSLITSVIAAMIYKDTYSMRILILDGNARKIIIFGSLVLFHSYIFMRWGLIPCGYWIAEGFHGEGKEHKDGKDE